MTANPSEHLLCARRYRAEDLSAKQIEAADWILIAILQMRKVRHREIRNWHKVTQLEDSGTIQTQAIGLYNPHL